MGVAPDGLPRNVGPLPVGSATDAADAIRRRRIGSRELTELVLARIDEINPSVNAIIELRREAALGAPAPPIGRSPAESSWGRGRSVLLGAHTPS